VEEGMAVMFDVRISTLEGNFLYSSAQDTTVASIIYSRKKDGALLQAIGMLLEGDSAEFITPTEKIAEYFPIETMDERVHMSLKIRRVQDAERWYFDQKYPDLLMDYELAEQEQLQRMLRQVEPRKVRKLGGMYYIIKKKGKGLRPVKGDRVTIHYEGFLLDSTKFDSTRDVETPFSYTLGEKEQVIQGVDISVRQLAPGGKALFIIPSQLAFSETGSSTGIVPPHTTVMYEIELLEVVPGDAEKSL
jgi:FKBP-type peptidyl-prolyl cis-trans isomerase